MFDAGIAQAMTKVTVWALPILTAIPLHEAAHGLAARRLGDDTAYRLGRVTLNPLRHIDPFGTIVLPALLLIAHSPFLFGYAKPVPVNFQRLRHPRRDMVLVAAAGPTMNILLALISAALVHVISYLPVVVSEWAIKTIGASIVLNLVLAVFNMIPLPPLDGGRVAVGLLPPSLGLRLARIERHGMLILLAMIFLLPLLGSTIGVDLNLLPHLLEQPVNLLFDAIVRLVGLTDAQADMLVRAILYQ